MPTFWRRSGVTFIVAIIRSILPCWRNCMRLDETAGSSSSLALSRSATSRARSGSKPTVARRIAETERLVIGLVAHDEHAALLDLVEGLSCRRRRRDEDAGQKTHAGGDQASQHWRSPSHDEPQQIRRVGAGFKPALAQQTRAGNLRRDRDSCRGGCETRPTRINIVL